MVGMPRPTPPKYRTTNWPEYNAALKRRGSLEVWFDPAMSWFAEPDGRSGRPLRFSDSAIEFCVTLKGLFQLPLRQVTGLVESLLRMAGLDWPAPDYTTLCRRQKSLSVDLGARASAGGLHLLVDSTGIKMIGEGEWKARKYGVSYRRQWRKVHIGIDAETFDIRAIEVTSNAVGDGQTLPDLLAQIPEDETIVTVGGDGAYDTRGCHAANHPQLTGPTPNRPYPPSTEKRYRPPMIHANAWGAPAAHRSGSAGRSAHSLSCRRGQIPSSWR